MTTAAAWIDELRTMPSRPRATSTIRLACGSSLYARGKRNPDSITYPDDRLRPILESTKGVILYQEQAMQIAKTIAGFSGAKADDLRKAIGKKNREAMAKLKPEFFDGCRASGTKPETIEWLWQTNERSADYSFNRSHAACYALISYRTAWLRANYPAEYMAARSFLPIALRRSSAFAPLKPATVVAICIACSW